MMLATCSDGYVFIDDIEGEMVNLYPVRSRVPIISEANDVLAQLELRIVVDWQPTRVACQIIAVVEPI